MKRWHRVLLEVFAPPALGATIFWLFALSGAVADGLAGRRSGGVEWLGQAWLMLAAYAYIFAGLPSLVYAAIMEWRFARGLDPACGRAVALSAGLGLLSGATIVAVMSGDRAGVASLSLWGGIGVIVGFALGAFVRWRTRAGRGK